MQFFLHFKASVLGFGDLSTITLVQQLEIWNFAIENSNLTIEL
jgi:hypothetical protein